MISAHERSVSDAFSAVNTQASPAISPTMTSTSSSGKNQSSWRILAR
jgi:hypothetical protein